jgi:hypothetical protein
VSGCDPDLTQGDRVLGVANTLKNGVVSNNRRYITRAGTKALHGKKLYGTHAGSHILFIV